MKVVGLDFSLAAPGIVVFDVDNNSLDVKSVTYRGYTDVQKLAKADDHFIYYTKKMFKDDIERYSYISSSVAAFIAEGTTLYEEVYIAIEGYALSSNGRIFETAEATGITKYEILGNDEIRPRLRVYEPKAIKKFGCLDGNGNKVSMGVAYDGLEVPYKIDLSGSHLTDYESPKADVIDAFWIAEMLLTELKLRRGLVALKGMPLKRIEVFNATSKGHKENLLEREYISRD